MSQEQTGKTITPLEKSSNKIRPYDTVGIIWKKVGKHKAEDTKEDVHPLLAKKLVDAGKATYADGSAEATVTATDKKNKRAE